MVTVNARRRRSLQLFASLALALGALAAAAPRAAAQAQDPANPHAGAPAELFLTSDGCLACHNGLVAPSGEDVSIGSAWRASMMANSARDPYWQAAVRREVLDHPTARQEIEGECSICHMPMARYPSKAAGGHGDLFAHLPVGQATTPEAAFAADGVSCTVCHQIQPDGLGEESSFTGGFVIDSKLPPGERQVFGPYEVDLGRTTIMKSATSFRPATATHLQQSEMCATCHTLITHSLGPAGEVVGELPEQVPYQEWLHSDFRETQSCQSCHMPVIEQPTPISSVLGEPREGFSRHDFRGGNFFMLGMLQRYRDELGVVAQPQELAAARERTLVHLREDAARLVIERAVVTGGTLIADLEVTNLAGHKLPTAYPSRRAWLHLVVRDGDGGVVFESGAFEPSGAIAGNDNDDDASRFEPHYSEIRQPDQVQIYEAILAAPDGAVTTGLLTAVGFHKDNRILPRGFDKASAPSQVAVHGEAARDDDFVGGADRVRYAVDLRDAKGPFRIEAELWYQPIAYRWAHNLAEYRATETDRFVGYYGSMSDASAALLARAEVAAE
jgi:cytochrome c551/c552